MEGINRSFRNFTGENLLRVKTLPNPLPFNEVVKLIEATHGTTKAMLLSMYLYGLRPREVNGVLINRVRVPEERERSVARDHSFCRVPGILVRQA